MPVELIAAWLLREAYKLIVVPVASDLRQRFVSKVDDKIAGTVSTRLFHNQAPGDSGAAANDRSADAGLDEDTQFVVTLESEPAAGEVLRGELEEILGVSLSGAGVRRGTPGWYVSAYSAILWRIAMLAIWEERPIATQGALQGREWVTVCLPRAQHSIDPSTMWRQSDDGTLLRVLPNQQVDFFVRQIKDERSRREELVTLNDRFTITPEAGFAPADVDPAEAGWHRIDGISRKWVLLKPDAATEEAILDGRSPRGLDGRRLFTFPLDSRPPEFNEYPVEWQPLLRIPNEGHGIAVLSAGADEFARASDASAAAVEAALQTEL